MGRNAQMRRFRRDLDKKLNHTGPAGEPHPFGNREYRRSKEGKAQMKLMLQKLRTMTQELAAGEKDDNRESA